MCRNDTPRVNSMFERNKIDTATVQQTSVAAEIALEDGRHMKGRFTISASRNFHDVLNGPTLFLEFEPFGGERVLIAKSALRTIKLTQVPQATGLAARARDIETFDPHAILGVTTASPWDDVRAAYHRLAKRYHPDRYAGVELPEEVAGYIAAMSQRVNAAFAALEAPRQATKAAAPRAEPIYTSRPRA